MRRLLGSAFLLCALGLAGFVVVSCDDEDGHTSNGDAGDASADAPVDVVIQPDTLPTSALSACLERPGELPRPPSTSLPCELIPPGLSL